MNTDFEVKINDNGDGTWKVSLGDPTTHSEHIDVTVTPDTQLLLDSGQKAKVHAASA